MKKIDIVYKKLSELKPYENNPRNNEGAVDKVAASIQEFGFKNPIIIDENNVIVAGHTRYQASIKLGLEEVPTVGADDLTEDQVRAFRIADNKTQEYATWDEELLAVELDALRMNDYDIANTFFDVEEIDAITEDGGEIPIEDIKEDEDFNFEEGNGPFTKNGDVWVLGKHRLMVGDSTSQQDVEKLMNGEKADLVVMDPPYNVNYEGGTGMKIQNDHMDNDSFFNFLYDVYTRCFEFLKDGAAMYVFHADTEGVNFRLAMTQAGFKLAQCCVWVKQSLVLGRQDYHWQHEPVLYGFKPEEMVRQDFETEHEPVLYGWKPTGAHHWYADRKQTTVWKFDRPTRNDLHPTMKPIALVAYPIQNSSKKGHLVVDLFGGSGSTLMAAEQTGRRCNTMELDTKYADVIVNRYVHAKEGDDSGVYVIRDGKTLSYSEVIDKWEGKHSH